MWNPKIILIVALMSVVIATVASVLIVSWRNSDARQRRIIRKYLKRTDKKTTGRAGSRSRGSGSTSGDSSRS